MAGHGLPVRFIDDYESVGAGLQRGEEAQENQAQKSIDAFHASLDGRWKKLLPENPIASRVGLREHARHVSPGVFCGRQWH